MADRLIELQQEIEDQRCLVEELTECGDLEDRLDAALELERLEAEFLQEKLRETGGC